MPLIPRGLNGWKRIRKGWKTVPSCWERFSDVYKRQIQLSEYIKLMPLEIAVFQNDVPMIPFLLEHGADPDLAVEQPLLLTVTRCCGAPGIRNCGIWTWSMRSSIPWPNGRILLQDVYKRQVYEFAGSIYEFSTGRRGDGA